MIYRASGADGLQVAPDQSGLHPVFDKPGLQVATIERQDGYDNYPQRALGKEEKIWNPRYDSNTLPEAVKAAPKHEPGRDPRKRRKFFWHIALGILILLTALAIGLGVGLSNRSKTSSSPDSQNPSPSASTPASSPSPSNSTSNPSLPILPRSAQKNTGVLAFYPATERDVLWLYWQDRTSAIRSLSYSYTSTWQSPSTLPIAPASVLPTTPLAGTFFYAHPGTRFTSTTYTIIYADASGTLQNLLATADDTSPNTTWVRGNLGDSGWKVPADRRVGMTVCGFDNLFGQGKGGLVLMAGGTDGLVHEYLFAYANASWVRGRVFEGTDGYGAATVTVDVNSTMLYMYAATGGDGGDEQKKTGLEFWWRSFGDKSAWKDGGWVKGAQAIAAVATNSSAAVVEDLGVAFYVDGDSNLASMNVSEVGINRRWSGQNNGGGNVKFRSSSQFGWLWITDEKVQQNPAVQGIHIFAQTNETNLVHIHGSVGNMTVAEDVPIFA